MTDIVPKSRRSEMMAGIKGKNTKPELLIRTSLHRMGLRYRLHDKRLPGKPDLVFPKYKAIILVNGCFWHGHNCQLFKWPNTRKAFWHQKIGETRKRDKANLREYQKLGWKTLTIWECAIKGRHQIGLEETIENTVRWLQFDTTDAEIRGEDQNRNEGC
ncbi:MAG: DNA mismatch endonuclease Vsr [Alcanivorax sp.]|nr:DNA mismatch endonuclease Vsr [Alcanivorax sp.]